MHKRSGLRFIKRAAIILLVITCVLIVAWLGVRNYVLHSVIHAAEVKFSTKYKTALTIKEDYFTGFARLSLIEIALVPESKDTLLDADTLTVEPSLMALLSGHLRLNFVSLSNAHLHLVKNDSTSNYGIFFHTQNNAEDTTVKAKDYAAVANTLLKNTFYYLPGDMNLAQVNITTQVNGKQESVMLSLHKHQRALDGSLTDLTQQAAWNIAGDMNRNNKTFSLKMYSTADKETKPLPFTEAFTATRVYFDTLFLSLDKNQFSHGSLSLAGKISAGSLKIHHDKIAQDDVLFNQLSYIYNFAISNHAITADSTDELHINDIVANAGFSYTNDTHKEFGIDLETDYIPATAFFASLPQGMFNNFEGMKADGQLHYSFHFKFNTDAPDSLEFESALTKKDFHITKYGVTNFAMMNHDFTYTAYEHDKPFRVIDVSPSNPNFTPLQNIPDCFKNAVLTSEDGSFFFHNGFNENAFKKSIAQNYEAGRFVRGGSTITMQLVKNVFLSRRKTVARKAEEALIVWLIESNHLVSKERMFEVYLNIIELGPNVYGVNEAAKFYFNKRASELTLPESIFLASLLPRPKWFKSSFDANGMLKPYYVDYFRVVSNFLLKKNLITQDQYDHLKPEITLQGPAKNVVMPTDSIPSMLNDDGE